MNRIAIPSELKRKLLLESGHRCAIPTCKHPEVEFHHIIPWEKCQEHTFDNMIVLCPNCHARADRGKIDRKSLLLYKANLQSILSLDLKIIPSNMDWEAKNYSEANKNIPLYEIDLWFPYFNVLKHSNLKEFNTYIQGVLLEEIFIVRRNFLDEYFYDVSLGKTSMSAIASSFEITCLTSNLLSIRFSYYSYTAGAAHPRHYTKTENFILEPTTKLGIYDLFNSSKALEEISNMARINLIQQRKENGFCVINESLDWINNGTKPDPINFQNFNLTSSSIVFTFDEYQIGPYAEGAFQVKLEISEVREYINPIIREKYLCV